MITYQQLLEELKSGKTVVMAFGRMNPPTSGHQILVEMVKKVAKQNKADHVIYLSKTQDKKKNPLTQEQKLYYANKMFPNTNFVGAGGVQRTFMEAATYLNKKYSNLIMIGGSDRVKSFEDILTKYNGKDFNFDSIEVISAGERDPDADDVSGMSASKLRELASKGDFNNFKKGIPTLLDNDIKKLMNDVRNGMGLDSISESVCIDTIRDLYYNNEIYNIGDIVETITGEEMIIIKKGTNHVIVEDSNGITHNKWLHEIVEK